MTRVHPHCSTYPRSQASHGQVKARLSTSQPFQFLIPPNLLGQALHPVPGLGGRRAGTAHRPAGEAGTRFSTGSLRHLQVSRLHHRPGRGDAGTGGRSSPSRRDRERDTRPQVRRGAEPSPLGPLRRQRRLAGGTGDGAQPGPLDSPHRPGSADRDHQDPQTTGLCLGRTDHPLGTPIDPASSPALALGGAVQPRPGPTASHSTPSLTAPVRH